MMVSAEDDPDIRMLIRMMLQASGYQVISVVDGVQAVEAVRAHLPDLVLLDVDMPHLDGLTACRMIRDDPATGHIPVLIVSGSLRPPYAELEVAGAVGVLPKPFTRQALEESVNAALATRAG